MLRAKSKYVVEIYGIGNGQHKNTINSVTNLLPSLQQSKMVIILSSSCHCTVKIEVSANMSVNLRTSLDSHML